MSDAAKQNGNAQAFPVPTVPGLPNGHIIFGAEGLTKREYAAIKIAAGLCADPSYDGDVAINAVKIADRLLAELSK